MTTTIRQVDASANAQRLFRLFEANEQDATHARAVIEEGGCHLWLAEDAGLLVGALLGRQLNALDGERRGGVDNLLVDAQHRRRGIGRRLMQEAEAYYQAQHLRGMQLAVNAENAVARSLYDSMSYVVVRRYSRSRRNPAGEQITKQRLLMWKQLSTNTARCCQ